MLRWPRWALTAAVLLIVSVGVAACDDAHTDSTDRQAEILTEAIAYPRQQDASGFARAALATRLGRSGDLAVLEATDLHADSPTDPAARLVIRIHVPAHVSTGFGDTSTPAYDACYRIEYQLPSSAAVESPQQVDCPTGAVPITPAPPPPTPRLPGKTSVVLAQTLRSLPPSPTSAEVEQALGSRLPPQVRVDALVRGGEVAVAAGVGTGAQVECRVAVRIGDHVQPVVPQPESLQPGEVGCRAALAFLD